MTRRPAAARRASQGEAMTPTKDELMTTPPGRFGGAAGSLDLSPGDTTIIAPASPCVFVCGTDTNTGTPASACAYCTLQKGRGASRPAGRRPHFAWHFTHSTRIAATNPPPYQPPVGAAGNELAWEELGCHVADRRRKGREITVLQGVCGHARSGELTAIIGAVRAGLDAWDWNPGASLFSCVRPTTHTGKGP